MKSPAHSFIKTFDSSNVSAWHYLKNEKIKRRQQDPYPPRARNSQSNVEQTHGQVHVIHKDKCFNGDLCKRHKRPEEIATHSSWEGRKSRKTSVRMWHSSEALAGEGQITRGGKDILVRTKNLCKGTEA